MSQLETKITNYTDHEPRATLWDLAALCWDTNTEPASVRTLRAARISYDDLTDHFDAVGSEA